MHVGGCQGLCRGENKEQLLNGYGFLFCGDEIILGNGRGSGCPTLGIH